MAPRRSAPDFKRPTMRQVAAQAGVSVSTVSRVLTDHPDVKEDTRQAVQTVIDSLGYRPSLLARGLILKRTNTLGLVVSDITNPFYPELAKGIEHAASERGWVVIVGDAERDGDRSDNHVDAMLERAVDGIVFASVTSHDQAVPRLVEVDYPVVLVNRRHLGVATHHVVADNVLGGRMAVGHLAGLGHRRIGHLAGPSWAANAIDREAGYVQGLREARLEASEELISRGEFSAEGGAVAMRRLLALAEPPSAVFATNDLMALGALEAIKDYGLRWPDDVAVVGFDDISLARSRLIELSTISHRIYEMGTRAVEILLQQVLDGPIDPPIQEMLKPELVVRGTCGGAPRA